MPSGFHRFGAADYFTLEGPVEPGPGEDVAGVGPVLPQMRTAVHDGGLGSQMKAFPEVQFEYLKGVIAHNAQVSYTRPLVRISVPLVRISVP